MKISIITVCYNAGKTIEKTLSSVVEQSWPDIEYIVVDGESTDKTIEIINRYRHRIACVISEPDQGIYDAMNKGIKEATGDYLLFLNADDYLIGENVMENVCRAIDKHEFPDIMYGHVLCYNRGTGRGYIAGPKKVALTHLYRSTIPHQSTFFKRNVFSVTGDYNIGYKILSDYELIFRAYRRGMVFKYEDMIVSVYDTGGTSSDHDSGLLILKEREMIRKNLLTVHERIYLRIRVRIKKIFNI